MIEVTQNNVQRTVDKTDCNLTEEDYLKMAYFGMGIANLLEGYKPERTATVKSTGKSYTFKELEKLLYGK